MKNTFKQKAAVQRTVAISTLVLIAVIGFSMAACGDDNNSKIYGCAYSDSEELTNISWDKTATITHYLLTISYDQARANIIQELGPGIEVNPAGLEIASHISLSNPSGLILEVKKHSDSEGLFIRLGKASGTNNRIHTWQTY
jgi:hypothetical protein